VRALRQPATATCASYSPVPHHDVERALEQGPSIGRWVTWAAALLGITGGFALCIYSVISVAARGRGKELISLPPFVVIATSR
jgi:hypothetical protein